MIGAVIASKAKQSSAARLDGRVARLLAMTGMMAVPLAACNPFAAPPELDACEEYTKELLKAPSTYKRAKAYVSNDRLPQAFWDEKFEQLFGEMEEGTAKAFKPLYQQYRKTGGLRTVTLQYDAENAMGVRLREVQSCKFIMNSFAEDKFETAPSATGSLASAYAKIGGLEIEHEGCCESTQEMKLLAKYESKIESVDQREID